MVSEFMLQQTPVARVLPVHAAWLEQWPTPAALAAVPSGEAVRAWGRLGYPRRALRLHAAAVAIVERHGGEVPVELRRPARAARRRRLHGGRDRGLRPRPPARRARHQRAPGARARARRRRVPGRLGDPGRTRRWPRACCPTTTPTAATWSVAVMELGALVCTAANPRCARLPGRRPVRVARGRPPGVRRAAAEGADLGRHRPPVPRPAAVGGPRDATGRCTAAGWTPPGPTTPQRTRCLESLLDDGLLVRTSDETYALP